MHPSVPTVPEEAWESTEYQEVEYLVKHRMHKNRIEYLVKWVNRSNEYNNWEKESELTPEVINSYWGY